jgi:hypothetical protein
MALENTGGISRKMKTMNIWDRTISISTKLVCIPLQLRLISEWSGGPRRMWCQSPVVSASGAEGNQGPITGRTFNLAGEDEKMKDIKDMINLYPELKWINPFLQ